MSDFESDEQQYTNAAEEQPGTGTRCFLCGKIIEYSDPNGKRPNYPVRVRSLPGYQHLRCAVENDMATVSNPISVASLEGEAKKIIGDR